MTKDKMNVVLITNENGIRVEHVTLVDGSERILATLPSGFWAYKTVGRTDDGDLDLLPTTTKGDAAAPESVEEALIAGGLWLQEQE